MSGAPGRVYLHIGMPKTGTSYLQSIYHASVDELARQGVALAPPSRRENVWLSQAVRGVLDTDRLPRRAGRVLQTFAEQVRSSDAEVLLASEEQLSGADPEQIASLVRSCEPREVHVVLTIRSLSSLLPSTWQQRIKQGSETPALEEFLDAVVHRSSGVGERWWDERGVQNVVERWSQHVPFARVHVITLPRRSSSEELLRRFSAVLGVDTTRLSESSARQNASLGHAEAELLRLVRERLPAELRTGPEYASVAKQWLAHQHLAGLGGEPARMPPRLRGWCEEQSEATIEFLESSGSDVVGDLDDLRPLPGDFEDRPPVSADQLVDAAVGALASVVGERMEGRAQRRAEPPEASPSEPPTRGAGRTLLDRLRPTK